MYIYAGWSWCGHTRILIPVWWSETRETLYHTLNLTFSYWFDWGMIMIYNHDLTKVTLRLAKCVNTFSIKKRVEIRNEFLSLG